MSFTSVILNILWLVFGGIWSGIGWLLAALIMAVTIIGLPWARAAFNIASYSFMPFGRKPVRRDRLTGREDIGTGPLGTLGNIVWLVLAGWWLALIHLTTAVVLAVSIIGIPFAWAHLKLASLSLWPVGYTIVDADTAGELPPRGNADQPPLRRNKSPSIDINLDVTGINPHPYHRRSIDDLPEN